MLRNLIFKPHKLHYVHRSKNSVFRGGVWGGAQHLSHFAFRRKAKWEVFRDALLSIIRRNHIKGKAIKRITAGIMALSMVGTALPAEVGHIALLEGFSITAHADSTTVSTWTDLKSAFDNASGAVTIILGTSIDTSEMLTVKSGANITLNLNGFTLNRGRTTADADGHVLIVNSGGVLTITDSGHYGKIKGGFANNGGAINNKGTLNIYGGTFTGNKAKEKGGAIYNYTGSTLTISGDVVIEDNECSGVEVSQGGAIYNMGTLTMDGATITGNSSTDAGGIFNASGAYADLYDVTITGNTSVSHGGGGIVNYGTVSLENTTITGNTAKTDGGGIWNNGTLNAKGRIVVKDNTANSRECNVYLKSDKVITLTDALDTRSEIGVSAEAKLPVFTLNYSTNLGSSDPNDYFFIDNSSDDLPAASNGEVYLVAANLLYYINRTWNPDSHSVESEMIPLALDSVKAFNGSFSESGTYIVMNNTTVSDRLSVPAQKDVKLILADGVTINCSKGINVSGVLNIYGQTEDSGKLIAAGGEEQAAIGGNKEYENGHINIYGGIIEATGGEKGAGIGTGSEAGSDNHNPQVNIYGGKVTATGGKYGVGIGGGYEAGINRITINGGQVTASAYSNGKKEYECGGAGIGAGAYGTIDGGTIEINDGFVWAYCGPGSACIGGGYGKNTGGTIRITGGNVRADASKIEHSDTINSGQYEKTSTCPGAGIGAGAMERWSGGDFTGTIEITGGTVEACCDSFINIGSGAAGIGAGNAGNMTGKIKISGGIVRATGDKGGAAIGAGSERYLNNLGGECSGTVTITGETLELKTTNTQNTAFIGHGDGDDVNGSLELGADMCVLINQTLVSTGNRVSFCRSEDNDNKLVIKRCNHSGENSLTYTINYNNTHTAHCKYCAVVFDDEAHNHDGENNSCSKCGFLDENSIKTVTVSTQDENGTATGVGVSVVQGRQFVLPECSSKPNGTAFIGWKVGDDTVLKQPGDEITVNEHITVMAQYESVSYISGANLSLNGEIGVNLFIKPSVTLGDGAYVMVKGPNDTEAQKVMLNDSTYNTNAQAYLVSTPVYAAQMGEQVEYTLYNSAGVAQELWNTARTKSYDTYTYSVKNYIDTAKAQKDDSNTPTKLAVLAQKMENYGAWSTTYMRNN